MEKSVKKISLRVLLGEDAIQAYHEGCFRRFVNDDNGSYEIITREFDTEAEKAAFIDGLGVAFQSDERFWDDEYVILGNRELLNY